MSIAYIGLGSNLGDRKYFLRNAVQLLNRQTGISVREQSPIFETDPYGLLEQGRFLNCVISVETTLTPEGILAACMQIEIMHGRERSVRWGPRTLDLDILLFDRIVMQTDTLTLPHPDMHKRRFVLEPLSRIAPDLMHPVLEKTIRDLLEALPSDTEAECTLIDETPQDAFLRDV